MKTVTAKQVVSKLKTRLAPILVRGGRVSLNDICLDDVMRPRGSKGRFQFNFDEKDLAREVKRQFPTATRIRVDFGEYEYTSVYLTATV